MEDRCKRNSDFFLRSRDPGHWFHQTVFLMALVLSRVYRYKAASDTAKTATVTVGIVKRTKACRGRIWD